MKGSGDSQADAPGVPGSLWQLTLGPAGLESPSGLRDHHDLDWLPARVPGTVAQCLKAAGRWHADMADLLLRSDAWYRHSLPVAPAQELCLEGVAGRLEVWLDDTLLVSHETMYRPVTFTLPAVTREGSSLYLCIRCPKSWNTPRSGRARWRPRMVVPASLREVRQTLLGHMPGWCPHVPALGPYGALHGRPAGARAFPAIETLRADWSDQTAMLDLLLTCPAQEGTAAPPGPAHLKIHVAGFVLEAVATGPSTWSVQATLPGVAPWWPHTHGEPRLHALAVEFEGETRTLGRIGFRRIEFDPLHSHRGLKVNGVDIFCRGACWTPTDLDSLWSTPRTYDDQIRRMTAAGMNMVRVGGTMVYEHDAFYEACDEAGMLVWQDYMLANFDYPARDPGFLAELQAEAHHFLRRTAIHPCIAVLCGGSEVRQQAEMLGSAWPADDPIYDGVLREASATHRPDASYVPNSPWGGPTPFSTRHAITHYYGVGAYMRPLEDARRADVGFAAECLALAHLPAEADLDGDLAKQPGHSDWKRGTPRDRGAGWDFDDVRDHYVQRLYAVDPAQLRYEDTARYLELGRAVSCDLAESLFSEWRRPGSGCAGGLVWQLRDLFPGAGWGLWNVNARPKPVWHALQRLLQPIQLLITDEGLDGLDLHVINETGATRDVTLTLTCLRDGEKVVAQGARDLTLPERSGLTLNSNELLGRFYDITYAYRFGPLAHEVTHAVLRDAHTQAVLSASFHLPRRALNRTDLGLQADVSEDADGLWMTVSTRRYAQYVHFTSHSHVADDDWFHLAPGHARRIRLRPAGNTAAADAALAGGTLTALNAGSGAWIKLPGPTPT